MKWLRRPAASDGVTVWCLTCGQEIEATRIGDDPRSPVFGPACPCGKSEGIRWDKP